MAKAFSAINKVSKTAKAIDFTSIIDGMPSQGFQVRDLISGVGSVPHSPANGDNLTSVAEMTRKMPATSNVSEESRGVGIDFKADNALPENTPLKDQIISFDESRIAQALNGEEIETNGCVTEEGIVTSRRCISRQGFGFLLENEKVQSEILVSCTGDASITNTIAKNSTPSEDNNTPSPPNEEGKSSKFVYLGSDAKDAAMDDCVQTDRKNEDNGSLSLQDMPLHEGVHDIPLCEYVPEEALNVAQGDDKIFAHQIKYMESSEKMDNNDSLATNHGSPEAMMEDQNHGAADSEVNLPVLVLNDASSQQNISERDSSINLGEANVIADQIPLVASCKMELSDDTLGANHEALEDIAIEMQLDGEIGPAINHLTSVKHISGSN